MVNLGFILFLSGLGLSGYLPYIGFGWPSIIIAASIMSVGGLFMQTKDGKLFNLYYRESKGLENHFGGISYLLRLFITSVIMWGILSTIIFFIAR